MSRAVLTFQCIAREMWHTEGMPSTSGLRARVRAELTQEIKDEARRQLAEEGASSLSLRAIARHLDMVSSGIYRYFKSRDQLLTALIVDAYEALGTAVEEADGRRDAPISPDDGTPAVTPCVTGLSPTRTNMP